MDGIRPLIAIVQTRYDCPHPNPHPPLTHLHPLSALPSLFSHLAPLFCTRFFPPNNSSTLIIFHFHVSPRVIFFVYFFFVSSAITTCTHIFQVNITSLPLLIFFFYYFTVVIRVKSLKSFNVLTPRSTV